MFHEPAGQVTPVASVHATGHANPGGDVHGRQVLLLPGDQVPLGHLLATTDRDEVLQLYPAEQAATDCPHWARVMAWDDQRETVDSHVGASPCSWLPQRRRLVRDVRLVRPRGRVPVRDVFERSSALGWDREHSVPHRSATSRQEPTTNHNPGGGEGARYTLP